MAHLIACTECKKHLQVPDELIGKRVQCPECQHTFTAAVDEEPVTTISGTGKISAPPPVPSQSKTPEWDKRSSSSSGSSSSGTKKRKRDDDDDEGGRYGVDDDDDDDDALPRRRRRRSSSSRGLMPHRGGMILAFGLVGLVAMGLFPVWLIFAIIAWIMGNSDMVEIRAGRMDPEGEGMTQAGRIMGMISSIIHIVSLVATVVLFGSCCFMGMIGAAGANRPPRRR